MYVSWSYKAADHFQTTPCELQQGLGFTLSGAVLNHN